MTSEFGTVYFELPGMDAKGTLQKENVAILHEHRDVIVNLYLPNVNQYRLRAEGTPFYLPKEKKLLAEHSFVSGEEQSVWLSKFDQWELHVEYQSQNGWKKFCTIDPASWDGGDYSNLLARPAPIVIKSGIESANSVGDALPTISTPASSSEPAFDRDRPPLFNPPQHQPLSLMSSHTPSRSDSQSSPASSGGGAACAHLEQVRLHAAHQGNVSRESLLGKWDEVGWSLMSRREGMQSCHATPEYEYSWVCEVHPGAKSYERISEETDFTVNSEALAEMVADAFVAAYGETLDKYHLVKELRGKNFSIVSQTMKDGKVKQFIILKGLPGLRKYFNGVRYGVGNNKVFTLAASQYSLKALAHEGLRNTGKVFSSRRGGLLATFSIAIDTAVWFEERSGEVEKLMAKISTSLLGLAIGAALTPAVTAIMGGLLVAFGASAALTVGIVVGAALIAFGIIIGIVLDDAGAENFFYSLYKRLTSEYGSDLSNIPLNMHTD